MVRCPTADASLIGQPAVEMPDVVGLQNTDAQDVLKFSGIAIFTVNVTGSGTALSGQVVGQSPPPGGLVGVETMTACELLPPGTQVSITVQR